MKVVYVNNKYKVFAGIEYTALIKSAGRKRNILLAVLVT